jgi:hypothetical protein
MLDEGPGGKPPGLFLTLRAIPAKAASLDETTDAGRMPGMKEGS